MGEENIVFCCPIGFGWCALCQLEKKVVWRKGYHVCFSFASFSQTESFCKFAWWESR